MGVARAPGHPNYSRDGISAFIPEIWSGKLQIKFYDATVFAAISNTEYQGEIKDVGDTIWIRTRGNVTIRKYVKGQTLTYERIESPAIQMVIDQGDYWAFACDDIDMYQSDIALMDQWSQDATEQQKIFIDTEQLALLKAQDHASNVGLTAGRISASYNMGVANTPVQLTKANVLDYIVDAGSVLDEQNIPETDRWMVIPAWVTGMIKKSDLKDASMTGDGKSTLRNGRIGVIDRFTMYNSNLLPITVESGPVNVWDIPFGHPLALTFASQFVKNETLRAESTFGDLVRGLHVYGSKVIKPEGLGTLYARK